MPTLTLTYPADENERALAEADRVACQWFALCDRAATGAVAHPVLGAVLACQRCADRAEATLERVSIS